MYKLRYTQGDGKTAVISFRDIDQVKYSENGLTLVNEKLTKFIIILSPLTIWDIRYES